MSPAAIILYGPPASGKSTVTRVLEGRSSEFRLFPRLKLGNGSTDGYRMTDAATLAALTEASEVAWQNTRYGSTYAVDTNELIRRAQLHVPVLHLGQRAGVSAVMFAAPDLAWLVVQLWCSRATCEQRLIARGALDVAARLDAWDATQRLDEPNLSFETDHVETEAVAAKIAARVQRLQAASKSA